MENVLALPENLRRHATFDREIRDRQENAENRNTQNGAGLRRTYQRDSFMPANITLIFCFKAIGIFPKGWCMMSFSLPFSLRKGGFLFFKIRTIPESHLVNDLPLPL